jgi:hypothetical protein
MNVEWEFLILADFHDGQKILPICAEGPAPVLKYRHSRMIACLNLPELGSEGLGTKLPPIIPVREIPHAKSAWRNPLITAGEVFSGPTFASQCHHLMRQSKGFIEDESCSVRQVNCLVQNPLAFADSR